MTVATQNYISKLSMKCCIIHPVVCSFLSVAGSATEHMVNLKCSNVGKTACVTFSTQLLNDLNSNFFAI